MKFAIIFMTLVAVGCAAVLPALLKHEEVHDSNHYTVEYHVDDGTVVKENGQRVLGGEEGDVWHKSGFYRYLSPEGQPIEVHYTADQDGFHPEGAHLPKAPLPLH